MPLRSQKLKKSTSTTRRPRTRASKLEAPKATRQRGRRSPGFSQNEPTASSSRVAAPTAAAPNANGRNDTLVAADSPACDRIVPSNLQRYELRSARKQALEKETENRYLLRNLAVTTYGTDTLRYQIGCTLVRALDQIQELAVLDQKKKKLMAAVTSANEGFPESCQSEYGRIFQETVQSIGPSPTGTPFIGSIANYSREELVLLGVTFSTRPSTLLLDNVMDDYWETAQSSGSDSAPTP